MMRNNSGFGVLLMQWYTNNKRDLPWRQTSDPYLIWVSEVILQQTRVVQGRAYYMRFVERFPNVQSLAMADEDEVLKLWQGLGYYSRARNLYFAAKSIVKDYGGIFPENHRDVLALKGIGDYTAAAITSFAYNQPYAAVDGNVYRVLARVFGIDIPINTLQGKKIFAELAQELLDVSQPGEYNQALMEFGALQCVPQSPDCASCPLNSFCEAYSQQKVSFYPVKQGKVKTRNRYFNYLDIRCRGRMLLHQRGSDDIWQGLYELPLIEVESALGLEQLHAVDRFQNILSDKGEVRVKHHMDSKHILSHQIIYARFYQVEVESLLHDSGFIEISESELHTYPISRLTEKYLLSL